MKISKSLILKTYNGPRHDVSTLHAMVILEIHHAKEIKQLHKGRNNLGFTPELRTTTDLMRMQITSNTLYEIQFSRYLHRFSGILCTLVYFDYKQCTTTLSVIGLAQIDLLPETT